MEATISSDDSNDSEIRSMKNELSEFGLEEENLSKDEMRDLLKALKNSKSTEKEESTVSSITTDSESPEKEPSCDIVENNSCSTSPKKTMKRRYLNVRDRRMPWSLLPSTLTQAEKARALAVYIKFMSINNYRQARQSANFATWPPPIQIIEETARVQPIRSTRSGRSVPVYADFDDDSSDLDFIVTKSKKRKVSTSENNGNDGVYTNKFLSLKRKPTKEENNRPIKELKMSTDNQFEVISPSSVKPKILSLIED